ncbi:MAG: hypothetical protein WBW74_01380 [Xanthobacteraceae bacterium]
MANRIHRMGRCPSPALGLWCTPATLVSRICAASRASDGCPRENIDIDEAAAHADFHSMPEREITFNTSHDSTVPRASFLQANSRSPRACRPGALLFSAAEEPLENRIMPSRPAQRAVARAVPLPHRRHAVTARGFASSGRTDPSERLEL